MLAVVNMGATSTDNELPVLDYYGSGTLVSTNRGRATVYVAFCQIKRGGRIQLITHGRG